MIRSLADARRHAGRRFRGDAIPREGEAFVIVHAPIKAACFIGVTRGADGIAFQDECIAVAVDAYFLHVEHVAGRLALEP